jgi:hypothetical protein
MTSGSGSVMVRSGTVLICSCHDLHVQPIFRANCPSPCDPQPASWIGSVNGTSGVPQGIGAVLHFLCQPLGVIQYQIKLPVDAYHGII